MISFLFFAVSLLTPAHAESLRDLANQALRMHIECGLTSGAVDCGELTRGFFTIYGSYFEQVNRREDALIRLKITDQVVSGRPTRYTLEWDSDPILDASNFSVVREIDPTTTDTITRLNTLIVTIAQYASGYLKIISGEIDGSGQLVLTLESPVEKKKPSKFSQGPFYINLYASGYGSKNGGNKSWNGYTGASVNYSTDKVRVMLGGDVSQSSTTVPSESGSISAKNTSVSSYAVAAYSVRKHWSFALVGSTYRNAGQNVRADNELTAGLEWELVPFRITETRELYVRFGGGVDDLALYSENDLGRLRQKYAMIFAQVYTDWAFAEGKAKFSLSGKVTSFPKYSGYEKLGGSSSITYRITPAIQVNGGYYLNYQKKSLTFPKNPDYSNPLQSMYLSGAPGVSSSYSFGINVTLGNSLRKSRDRRWNY